MNKDKYNLSIILPVLNERKNLEFLVPELSLILDKTCDQFEIIVIDDNSNDNTDQLLIEFKEKFNINYRIRRQNNSLSLSILEGVNIAEYSNLMWFDADGSVDINSIEKLINFHRSEQESVFIGSRFVNGGGYKGQLKYNKSIFNTLRNIKNSEDSIVAIYLSVIFNKILNIILKIHVKDLTSGFIIGKKEYFVKDMFENFYYGEYFINVVTKLYLSKTQIREVPFINKPRIYGKSKTSTNIFRLLQLSLPYIKQAILCKRLLKHENFR